MKCYFCGIYKETGKDKLDKGICSFSIPELGILHRSVVDDDDDKDEILLDFSSLLLLFEFVILNPLFFKSVSFLDLKGSNTKVLEYLNSEKGIPKKVIPFKNASVAFCLELRKMGIESHFIKVFKSKNLALLGVDTLKIDKELMTFLASTQQETKK